MGLSTALFLRVLRERHSSISPAVLQPTGRLGLIAAVLTCLMMASGCGNDSGESSDGKESSPAPIATVDPALDYADPQKVCEGLARAIFTRDATQDTSEGESYRRTRPYLTAQAYGADGGATGGRNSVTWQEWIDHRAKTTVAVEPFIGDGFSAVAGQQATATTVNVTPHGAEGWKGPTTTHNVFCTLAQGNGGLWRVTEYDTEDLDATE